MSNSTNSKFVLDKIRQHVTERVTIDGVTLPTFHDAATELWRDYTATYDYPDNRKRYPNNPHRFAEYLNGVPQNFEYFSNGIQDFITSLDLNNNSGRVFDDTEMSNLYHYLIYKVVLREISK
jgi:hypothetical protein